MKKMKIEMLDYKAYYNRGSLPACLVRIHMLGDFLIAINDYTYKLAINHQITIICNNQ